MSTPTLDQLSSLCRRRGFVFPTSDIYGGLANSYDYGPVGIELLRNIRNLWWQTFIHGRTDMVGLDSQILLHPQTWVASGHVGSFSDPLVEDKISKKRYRADHLIEAWIAKQKDADKYPSVENMKIEEMAVFIKEHKIISPDGNELTDPKSFNLLFESSIGVVAGEKSKVYLRGETAQGIFSDFKPVLDSTRVQLPFGVGQIGRSFRNEITMGQFVFRTIEFEQAEIEYFFDPTKSDWQKIFKEWQDQMWTFVTKKLGVSEEHIRWRQHTDKERSHYSKETYDLDYQFAFGWKELWGIAYRTDYDLKQHMQFSGKSMEYSDPQTGEKMVPHVIEPALGLNRAFLMVLADSYWFDEAKNRTVLKLKPSLAPYKVAVFPLVKNKEEIVAKAKEVFSLCSEVAYSAWDERGNIGKRYLSQDEIGTPACITIDYQTMEDGTITWRDRNTAEQTRIKIDEIQAKIKGML